MMMMMMDDGQNRLEETKRHTLHALPYLLYPQTHTFTPHTSAQTQTPTCTPHPFPVVEERRRRRGRGRWRGRRRRMYRVRYSKTNKFSRSTDYLSTCTCTCLILVLSAPSLFPTSTVLESTFLHFGPWQLYERRAIFVPPFRCFRRVKPH